MNNNDETKKVEDAELATRLETQDEVKLSNDELEEVSGGFLDAKGGHGNVCIGLATGMATVEMGK